MIERLGSSELLHAAVVHGNVVYLSGVTADDRMAGMAAQTRQALDKIARWLGHFGSDRSCMLSASIFITDMSLKDEMNLAWRSWFDGVGLPARSTIGASDLGPGALIEVVVTAARRASVEP